MATPEQLVRKISDLMHILNVNGLDGDAALDAVDQFVDALSALVPTGGGGGAGINDAVIAPNSTWSSKRISELLAQHAPANWSTELADYGGAEGAPVDTGNTVSQALDAAMLTAGEAVSGMSAAMVFSRDDMQQFGISRRGSFLVAVTDLPASPDPGKVYAVIAPDGTMTFHLPNPAVNGGV